MDQQIKDLRERAADWTENSHCGCAGITSLPEGSTGPDGVPETCDDLLDHICDRPKPEQLDMLSERLNEAFKIQFDTDKKNSANETYQVVLNVTLTTRGDNDASLAYWRSKIEADYAVLLADNAEIDDDIEKCYQVFGAYAESYNTLEYNVASALVDGALAVDPNENDLDALENTHGKTTYDPTYDFEAAYDQIIINKSQVYTQIIKVDYNAATDYIYGQTIANSGVVTDDIASATYSLMIADPNTNYNTNTSSTTPDVTDKDAWVLGLNYHRCAETYFNFDPTTGIGTLKLQGISYDEAVKAVKQCVAQNSIDINTESYFDGGVESQVVNAREGAILSMKKHIAKCKAFCEEKRTGAFVFAVDNQIKEYNEANGVYSIHDEANWKTYEELTAEGNNPFGTDSKECLINSLVNNCENKCEQPLQLQFLEEKKQVDPTTQLPIETDEAYVLRLKNSYTNNSTYNEGVFLEQQHMREAMNYAVDVAPVLVDGYTTGAPIEQVEQEIIDFIYAELDKGINYRLFDAPTSTCLSGECGARSQNKTLYVKNNGSNLGLNLKVSTTFENMTPQNIDLDKKKYRLKTISIYLDFLTGGTFFNVSLTNHSDMSNAFNLDAAYTDIKSEIFNLYFDKDHVVHLVLPDEENWFGNVNPITSNTRLVKNDGASGWLASILFSKKIALGTAEKVIKVSLKDLSPIILVSQGTEIQVNLQSQEIDGNRDVLYLHDQPITIKPEYSDLTVFAQDLANQINSSQHSSIRAKSDGDDLIIYFNNNSQFSGRTFNQNLYFDSGEVLFTDNTNEIAFAVYGKVDFMKEIKPINEFYKFPGNFGGSVVQEDCPVGYEKTSINNYSLYFRNHRSLELISTLK